MSEGASQIAKKREEQKSRRKGKLYPSECRVSKNSKERKESLLKQTMQRNRESLLKQTMQRNREKQ